MSTKKHTGGSRFLIDGKEVTKDEYLAAKAKAKAAKPVAKAPAQDKGSNG
ncbi:hypothetical protein [uncultured Rheinheimera sp.]|jgi:hypothetical protein|nr:hypothetical protein [uncultured Rheinheimera sp.]